MWAALVKLEYCQNNFRIKCQLVKKYNYLFLESLLCIGFIMFLKTVFIHSHHGHQDLEYLRLCCDL